MVGIYSVFESNEKFRFEKVSMEEFFVITHGKVLDLESCFTSIRHANSDFVLLKKRNREDLQVLPPSRRLGGAGQGRKHAPEWKIEAQKRDDKN